MKGKLKKNQKAPPQIPMSPGTNARYWLWCFVYILALSCHHSDTIDQPEDKIDATFGYKEVSSNDGEASDLLNISQPIKVDVNIDPLITYQTIQGFGTSMINWRTSPANIQDLYTTAGYLDAYFDDLGFSVVRIPVVPDIMYNDSKEIPYTKIKYQNMDFEAGRIDWGWKNVDGKVTYNPKVAKDYSRAKSVHDYAKRMQQRNGQTKFIASVWSPPDWMKPRLWDHETENRKIAITPRGGNLLPEYYKHFGKYLVEWVKGMKALYNVDIYAISIQNEPRFNQSYDSCVYTKYNHQTGAFGNYSEVFKSVVDEFKKANMSMRFFGPESMAHYYNNHQKMSESEEYLKGILEDESYRSYVNAVAAHGYSDGVHSVTEPTYDARQWELAKRFKLQYWMTETGGGEASWPDPLIGIGRGVHNILVHGNGSLVAFWQTASGNRDQVSQHELMAYDNHTKKSYVMMHYSKFVRPGYVRVEAIPSEIDSMSISSYYHNDSLVIVIVNASGENRRVRMKIKNYPKKNFVFYKTTSSLNLKKQSELSLDGGNILAVTSDEKSIITLVSTDTPSAFKGEVTPRD